MIDKTRKIHEKGSDTRNRIRGVLFDMDGTLTVPGALDFAAIKREIGCPPDIPILEYIESRPEWERPSLFAVLERHETEAAENSVLGIITRNSLCSVEKVLRKFDGICKEDFSAIITRETALPKPHPQGVYMAAEKMGVHLQELLVVGDYRFDIMAGKAAGAKTALLINEQESE
ncbi:MAG: HAD family hydrolase, partial [Deltaproteobacteria bacterium]|nr:HAD family hydrolase [Deltaproteobacteria bacterium]